MIIVDLVIHDWFFKDMHVMSLDALTALANHPLKLNYSINIFQ